MYCLVYNYCVGTGGKDVLGKDTTSSGLSLSVDAFGVEKGNCFKAGLTGLLTPLATNVTEKVGGGVGAGESDI